jgi:hypothetical protein
MSRKLLRSNLQWSESELCDLATKLPARIEQDAHDIHWHDAEWEKLAYQIAHLRSLKFSVRSEQLNVQQRALSKKPVEVDIAVLECRVQGLTCTCYSG